MRRTFYVDILNFSTLGEVFHHSGAVEDRVNLAIHLDILGHIAVDDAQTIAKQFFIVVAEVVIQHSFQAAFCFLLIFCSHHAPDGRHILTVDEFLKDMDTQETGGTRKQHVTNSLFFSISESIEGIAFEDAVDRTVVIAASLFILVNGASSEEGGQHSRCGVGKHVTVSDMMASLVGLDDDTRHHEGCSAQLEEVVGSANLVHRQNVAVNLAEKLLNLVGRLHIFVVISLDDRRRQCLAVHFLVLIQRNRVNLHRGRRNHVGRFLLADEGVEFLDVHLLVADDICGNVLATVLIVKGLHGDILDTWELANHGLHFFQLDTEATDFHLTVLATHKLNVAIGKVTHDVTGAIHTIMFRVIAERILQVGFGGLFGTVQVATTHLRSRDP